ncbi:hypothetical protein [Nocardia brevicatena]|uniref:hypothetical protein n=1 Tax=Nocardia brevicatena TaxID=37327 RepID=UPI0003076450
MSLVGTFGGRGAGITSTSFEHCAYPGTFFPGNLLTQGREVQVLDVSNPANPRPTVILTEPAMVGGNRESPKANAKRKLLVGTGVPFLVGAGFLSVYDVSDCAHPRLLDPGPGTNPAMPLPITTHEGGFSPDGNTYWASGLTPRPPQRRPASRPRSVGASHRPPGEPDRSGLRLDLLRYPGLRYPRPARHP